MSRSDGDASGVGVARKDAIARMAFDLRGVHQRVEEREHDDRAGELLVIGKIDAVEVRAHGVAGEVRGDFIDGHGPEGSVEPGEGPSLDLLQEASSDIPVFDELCGAAKQSPIAIAIDDRNASLFVPCPSLLAEAISNFEHPPPAKQNLMRCSMWYHGRLSVSVEPASQA